MTRASAAAPPPRPDSNWIVERVPVAPSRFVSSAAGMWKLEIEKRRPPLATSDITAVLEEMIEPFRRLDDEEGGSAAAVNMVNTQIQTITAYLTRGRTTTPQVRQRLMRANAQFNQLAGWMAFDAERHGTAERYFRTGLAAARDAADADLTAYILGCMACHAAYGGQLSAATQIADAAVHTAREAQPAVRSIVASRSGYARAAAGDRTGFEVAADDAQQIWATAADAGPKPEFLYWYGQNYIDIQRGESLQLLAFAAPRHATDALREADELLDTRIRQNAQRMPRDVALHSAQLARTHVRRGEIDRAVSITEHAITQLRSVRSPRVRTALRAVSRDLTQSRAARSMPRVRQLCQRIQFLTSDNVASQ